MCVARVSIADFVKVRVPTATTTAAVAAPERAAAEHTLNAPTVYYARMPCFGGGRQLRGRSSSATFIAGRTPTSSFGSTVAAAAVERQVLRTGLTSSARHKHASANEWHQQDLTAYDMTYRWENDRCRQARDRISEVTYAKKKTTDDPHASIKMLLAVIVLPPRKTQLYVICDGCQSIIRRSHCT